MTEAEMKQRTKQFALRIIKLIGALPRTTEGRAIAAQLVRSGTSVGANYRAACRGRSKAEFISKLGNVEEEADESAYWMELTIEAGLFPEERVGPPRRKARPHSKSALRIRCNNRRSYRITWHGLFSGHSVPEYYLTDPEGS
jgi:four helix bundle protein